MPPTETADKYHQESSERTPIAVYMIRRFAPAAAVGAWLIIFLALADVPEPIIEALLMGISVPVSVIIASYLVLWTGGGAEWFS
jgi:hypothetical protein